jgi:mannose/fructose-specific phosphotransferase system component IIA
MKAMVITHGNIGAELVAVVESIIGPVEGLVAMTNHGKGTEDMVGEINTWLQKDPSEFNLIMVDDYGGSCAVAAQLASAQREDVAILSGVNLAMLLGFVTWRENTDFDDLVVKLVNKAREAITLIGGN